MRLEASKLRYKFGFACAIWTREKEIPFCNDLLVKTMHLSQLFFHMLTLKALAELNVTDR